MYSVYLRARGERDMCPVYCFSVLLVVAPYRRKIIAKDIMILYLYYIGIHLVCVHIM